MGHCKKISWSWSRQRVLERCPRQFFYAYYLWGEPKQNLYAFFKRARTIPLLIGDTVHYFVGLALRHYQENGRDIGDLTPHAIRHWDEQMETSLRLADRVRKGLSPDNHESVMMHHLEGGSSEVPESAGKATMLEGIEAFWESEALKFLKTTSRHDWLPIANSAQDPVHVTASVDLGFAPATKGLQVYTPYDVALKHGKTWYIIDWKTGKKTARSVHEGIKQIGAYSMALPVAKGDDVAVQPFFLKPGEDWAPNLVTQEEIDEVKRGVDEHYLKETSLLTKEKIGEGNWKRNVWKADREDFPPKPVKVFCAMCNFRFVCKAGRDTLMEANGKQFESGLD
ncbi:MAG: PD-(D/E)XK nuclease family protein [Chthonomonas sp.]|nr:PD-(D/E)XK nuclease family protein [Chthonomonas sp.]